MSNDDVTIQIGAKVEEALNALKAIRTSVGEVQVQSSTASISMGAFIGTLAEKGLEKGVELLKEIPEFLKSAVEKASEANASFQYFNTSLALVGKYSADASNEFKEFALGLSKSSRFTEEYILKNAGLIESLTGLDKEGLKKATDGAVQLASVMGKDLSETSAALARAATGNIATLQRMGLRFETTGDSAKDFQIILKTIEERFSGAAQSQMDSYQGKVNLVDKAYDHFKETLGSLWTNNETVLSGLDKQISNWERLEQTILRNKDAINGFISGVTKFVQSGFVNSSGLPTLGMPTFGVGDRSPSTPAISGLFNSVAQPQSIGGGVLAGATGGGVLQNQFSALDNLSAQNAKSHVETKSEIEAAAADKAYREGLVTDQQDENRKASRKRTDEKFKFGEELKDATIGADYRLGSQIGKQSQDLFTDSKVGIGAITDEQKQRMATNQTVGVGVGSVGNILGGAAGAANMISQGIGAIGDKILPGLGTAAQPIIKALFGGPEATKGLVKSFTEAVPVLIENFIEAIPTLISSIAEQTPIMIESIVQKIPLIVNSLISQAPKVMIAVALESPKMIAVLVAEAPRIATSLISELIKGAPNMVGAMIKGLADGIMNIFKKLNPFGGGGGGSFLSNIPVIGSLFAEGGQGMIKSVPSGFPNDSFPARLTTDELVIDSSTTKKLKDFLNGSGRNDSGISNGLLSQILDAVQLPISVQSDLKIDNRTFAQTVLNLVRTNSRLFA